MSNKVSLKTVKGSPDVKLVYNENNEPIAIKGLKGISKNMQINLKFVHKDAIDYLALKQGKRKMKTDMRNLLFQKEGMVDYLRLKLEQEDWHGVADAAMDIREIEAKLQVLKELKGDEGE